MRRSRSSAGAEQPGERRRNDGTRSDRRRHRRALVTLRRLHEARDRLRLTAAEQNIVAQPLLALGARAQQQAGLAQEVALLLVAAAVAHDETRAGDKAHER